MKRFLLLPLLVLFACPAHAAGDTTFIYSKTILKIVPGPQASAPEPADKVAGKSAALLPDGMLPKLKRAPKEFTVEVRLPAFLKQTDFIAHQPFTDKEGMLILIDPPAVADVSATRMIASADVLFADADGNIIKIAPSLKLAGLSESISSDKPIHAFVYLKAGTAEANDIRLGDRIENAAFKTHPVVIQ